MSHILVDASSLTSYLACPELFRRKYIANQISVYPAVARELGIAVHEGVEAYWKGESFTAALSRASSRFLAIDSRVHANDRRKYADALDYLPDLLAFYYDHVGQHYSVKPALVEHQFRIDNPFDIGGVSVIGRLDRFMEDGTLVDLKTASEIEGPDCFGEKKGWRKQYREMMLRDCGLALYDWALREMGHEVKRIQLEVLLKPYRGKACRLEILDMPELMAYRERFAGQLHLALADLLVDATADSWRMSTSACSGKYGPCDQLAYCLYGDIPRVQKLYQIRAEHLEGVEKRWIP